jgi:hypothetical protein
MCSVIFTTKETRDERDLIERASRLELETGIFIVFLCSFETYAAHLIAVAVYLTGGPNGVAMRSNTRGFSAIT